MVFSVADRQSAATWGRVGGLTRAAQVGGKALAQVARRGLEVKWAREIDPTGEMDPRELEERLHSRTLANMERVREAKRQAAVARKADRALLAAVGLVGECHWCQFERDVTPSANATSRTCAKHLRELNRQLARRQRQLDREREIERENERATA